MASLIWLGNLFGSQERIKAHDVFSGYPESLSSYYNLDEDIHRDGNSLSAIIAKGNVIEGVEAKT